MSNLPEVAQGCRHPEVARRPKDLQAADDWNLQVRAAEPGDNAARCEVFARVAMEADLVLSVRRDPAFDALYRLQSRDWMSLVVEQDGVIEGTGTIVVRDGYVGGQVRRVGYLGDLRFSPRVQGRMLLDRFFAPLLEEARSRWGCELFLTSVISSNERALRALTRETRRSRAAGRPRYVPVGDFDIRSLHLLFPRRDELTPFRVRRATETDIPALASLLDADARRRPFGFILTEGELRRRLREWPGLTIDAFYLAESRTRQGEIVGCVALWDAAPVKRMVVQEYRGPMRRVRTAYNLTAAVLGAPRLPDPGDALRYLYVTHQAIPSDDPRILRALLTRAHRDVRSARQGYHFLSICAPRHAGLERAFHGLHRSNLAARLFVVSLPDVDTTSVAAADVWPGFEMALV